MTRFRTVTFAAALLSAAGFTAAAQDLGGSLGNAVGGLTGGLTGGITGGGVNAGSAVGGVQDAATGVLNDSGLARGSDIVTGSRLGRNRDRAQRQNDTIQTLAGVVAVAEPTVQSVETALVQAGFTQDIPDSLLNQAGLPSTASIPLTVTLLAGTAAAIFSSPDPALTAQRFIAYQVEQAKHRVTTLAGAE